MQKPNSGRKKRKVRKEVPPTETAIVTDRHGGRSKEFRAELLPGFYEKEVFSIREQAKSKTCRNRSPKPNRRTPVN